ncbi:MAG: DUF6089 family protein [Janthinobacterium lividum]
MTKFFTYSSAVLAGLALLGSAQQANAQQFSKRKQYTSIGVSLNAMNYFGDLNPLTNFASFHVGDTRPDLGLSITHRFFPRVSGRFALSYGQITADDHVNADKADTEARFRYTRNASFRNNIAEASAVVIVDLIENRNDYRKRPDFVPYVFGGVAGFYHNPQAKNLAGEYKNLQELKTEGVDYSKFQLSLPFGAGVRYRVSSNLDASLEVGFRKTFTGYLDDVSGTYATADKLTSPDALYFGGMGGTTGRGITSNDAGLAAGFTPGQKRGQGKSDWYVVTGVSLNYILNTKFKNPKFR